ncbi:hypothetical protein C1X05_15330 [Laceyella sacchari]|nr:hypothetical protein C1X05_15330 [Laceyella sacchari]
MKLWRERVKQRFWSKRGASTVEYIIIIAVGALFAGLLLVAINSPDIQQSLQEEVEEVLNGTPSSHDIEKPPLPTLPQISMGNQTKPPSFSDVQPMNPPAKKEPSFLDQLKKKTMDGINWAGDKIDQGLNWLDQQKDQIVNDDIKRAINEPGAYFSEVFGLEDYKAAWDKLTSDPLGYAKDSWNNLKASVNEIIEDPFTLIFDKDMFMEAWNGKDKNGKSIPLPNRLWNMVESLPTPVKLVKVGRIAKDTLVPDSCHCAMPNPKKDKDDDNDSREFQTNHPKKPSDLRAGVQNFSYEIYTDSNGVRRMRTSDGRDFKLSFSYPNETKTKTTKEGNTYTVEYDSEGFPKFEPHAKKDKDGKPITIQLPADAIVGSSGSQTKFATILLKERYINKYGDKWKDQLRSEGFTDGQIDSIDKELGSIGPVRDKKNKLTWHHHQETGKMILIPFDLNNAFKHTGGHKVWGAQSVN